MEKVTLEMRYLRFAILMLIGISFSSLVKRQSSELILASEYMQVVFFSFVCTAGTSQLLRDKLRFKFFLRIILAVSVANSLMFLCLAKLPLNLILTAVGSLGWVGLEIYGRRY